MTPAREFAAGDCVRVTGARGEVIGSLMALTTPAELPALPSHDFDELKTAIVRRLLEAWRVDCIALLSYRWRGPTRSREVAFCALRIAGRWYDLKHQELTITAVPVAKP